MHHEWKGHFKHLALHGVANPRDWAASPLHVAATNGNVEMVEALLEAGAQVNQKALLFGVDSENPDIVRILIRAGADVNAKLGESFPTPLPFVACEGWVPVIKVLLECGAKVDAFAMRCGIESNDVDVVRLLVNAGGDVNAGLGKGYGSPLQYAASHDQTSNLVPELLKLGATPQEGATELPSGSRVPNAENDSGEDSEDGAEESVEGGAEGDDEDNWEDDTSDDSDYDTSDDSDYDTSDDSDYDLTDVTYNLLYGSL
jgi:ankyrin repeat protein